MTMSTESPIAHFEFISGPQRGSRLTLYPARLLHEGAGHMESMPLDALAAVGAAYARDERKIGWGAALIVLALVLLAVFRPLAQLAAGAGAQVADGQAVGQLLRATLGALEALANLLPLAAGACLAGGVALAVFGWLGNTTLTLMLPAGERGYSVRGRNTLLADFASLLAERAAQRVR
ncbi:MAG TPA: hypothetical protein VF876_02375 [Burkholderiales bacterium]